MSYKVALLFDKNNDWIYPYFESYDFKLEDYQISMCFKAEEIYDFDIVFLIGFTKILPNDFLHKNSLTLVVHESDLPEGKGFAPIQWQLLEGKSEIKVSLIEALEKVDSGDIFFQNTIVFDGTELYDEIRHMQAMATIGIINRFLKDYPNYARTKQSGKESFFPKRRAEDGELDVLKSIEDNFNLLRIGNNDDWPSFFYYKGAKFFVKIYKE